MQRPADFDPQSSRPTVGSCVAGPRNHTGRQRAEHAVHPVRWPLLLPAYVDASNRPDIDHVVALAAAWRDRSRWLGYGVTP